MIDQPKEHRDQKPQNHTKEANTSPQVSQRSWIWTVSAGAVALIFGIGILSLIWFLLRPLAILFLGITLASALAPIVAWLENWLPRNWATILIFVILALLLIGIGAIILPMLVDQAEQLVDQAPEYAEQAESWLEKRLGMRRDGLPYQQILSQFTGIASQLAQLPVEISSSLVDTFLVAFIALYALILAPDTHKTLLSLFPKRHQDKIDQVLSKLIHNIGGYFRGATITGIIIGSVTYIALLLIGIDFPLVLAIIAGLAEFIPFLGPFVAGAMIVIFSFLQTPTKAWISLIFVIILQQFEGNIIAPNIMHPQTHISSLATVVIIFAGWSVGGVLGALVAIPLYAGLRVLFTELMFPAIRRKSGAEPITKDNTT
jgi:predicted PurR-regulated permease PerM